MALQEKLLQAFRLIRLLNTPPAKDVPQLVRRLNSNKSVVYRMLQTLVEIGYPIETDEKNRKFLKFTIPKSGNGVLNLDDINYIQELLEKQKKNDVYAKSILEKLNKNLNLIPIADALPQLHQNYILQLIRTGINTGECLKLIRYRSLTSKTTQNRKIEPLEITDDERYLIAWDLDKKDQRQFKIERIEDIEILNKKVNKERIGSPMDLFGLTGDEWHNVQLKLSGTAYYLLLEEFPLSRAFIRKSGTKVLFEGRVRNWKGIGRFVLGLPGEVEVLGPDAFQAYLLKNISKF